MPHHNFYTFNDTSYLIAKNDIDAKSYNKVVFENLKKMISNRIAFKRTSINNNSNGNNNFIVVDIGAGLMPLLSRISKIINDSNNEKSENTILKYIAFESNDNLKPTIEQGLLSSSFTKIDGNTSDISTFVRYSK